MKYARHRKPLLSSPKHTRKHAVRSNVPHFLTRRDVFGLAGVSLLWPAPILADRIRLIGMIMAYAENDAEGQERLNIFRQSLRSSGWEEEVKTRIEVRWLADTPDRAKAHAEELVSHSPDVIVVNGSPGLAAVEQATLSIPVVFVVVTDPVGAGFIPRLSRPGGNITGFSTFEPEIGAKWLEVLLQAVPSTRHVGVLMDGQFRGFSDIWNVIQSTAPSFGLQAFQLDTRDSASIDAAMQQFSQQPNAGLIVLPTPANAVHRERILSFTAEHRLPAIYPFSYFAKEGGLIAYGFDSRDLFRRAAAYVARLLQGARAGDLPVQAPTKYELVVNLKTANFLGLRLPPAFLARADEVIE